MLAELSSREISEWMAFYEMEFHEPVKRESPPTPEQIQANAARMFAKMDAVN